MYRYSVAMKKRIVVVEDPATPDVTDRVILGRVRPLLGTGRHVHPLTEPEQLRGPYEAATTRPSVQFSLQLNSALGEQELTPTVMMPDEDKPRTSIDWRTPTERRCQDRP